MHSFPWGFDTLFNVLFVLFTWQFWTMLGFVVIGLLAVWLSKRKP